MRFGSRREPHGTVADRYARHHAERCAGLKRVTLPESLLATQIERNAAASADRPAADQRSGRVQPVEPLVQLKKASLRPGHDPYRLGRGHALRSAVLRTGTGAPTGYAVTAGSAGVWSGLVGGVVLGKPQRDDHGDKCDEEGRERDPSARAPSWCARAPARGWLESGSPGGRLRMRMGRSAHRDSSLMRLSSAALVTQIRPSPPVAIPDGSSGTRTTPPEMLFPRVSTLVTTSRSSVRRPRASAGRARAPPAFRRPARSSGSGPPMNAGTFSDHAVTRHRGPDLGRLRRQRRSGSAERDRDADHEPRAGIDRAQLAVERVEHPEPVAAEAERATRLDPNDVARHNRIRVGIDPAAHGRPR